MRKCQISLIHKQVKEIKWSYPQRFPGVLDKYVWNLKTNWLSVITMKKWHQGSQRHLKSIDNSKPILLHFLSLTSKPDKGGQLDFFSYSQMASGCLLWNHCSTPLTSDPVGLLAMYGKQAWLRDVGQFIVESNQHGPPSREDSVPWVLSVFWILPRMQVTLDKSPNPQVSGTVEQVCSIRQWHGLSRISPYVELQPFKEREGNKPRTIFPNGWLHPPQQRGMESLKWFMEEERRHRNH